MNAYELAKYLNEQMNGWATDLVLGEAAKMLIMQAEEIEALRSQLNESTQN